MQLRMDKCGMWRLDAISDRRPLAFLQVYMEGLRPNDAVTAAQRALDIMQVGTER